MFATQKGVFGRVTKFDDAHRGGAAFAPSSLWYWHLKVFNAKAAANHDFTVNLKITYHASWNDPQTLAMS